MTASDQRPRTGPLNSWQRSLTPQNLGLLKKKKKTLAKRRWKIMNGQELVNKDSTELKGNYLW